MDSPRPTPQEFEELKAELTELREQVAALEGALNALVVVWAVRRLPHPEDND